MQLKQQNKKFI